MVKKVELTTLDFNFFGTHILGFDDPHKRARYVMFDENTDNNKLIFGLNKIQILDGANIITGKIIKELIEK